MKLFKFFILPLIFVIPGLCFAAENCLLISSHLQISQQGPEIAKLQTFLREEGFSYVIVNNVFDGDTLNAVRAFQEKYKEDILKPWGASQPTGYVYITTSKKINELHCGKEYPLTEAQKEEIESYKNLPQLQKEMKEVGLAPEENLDAGFNDLEFSEEFGEINDLAAAGATELGWKSKIFSNLPKIILIAFVFGLLVLLYRSLSLGKQERI